VYDYRPHLVDGEWFEQDDDVPIVLGAGLAESLSAQLGDRLVLTATDPGGEVTRALFRLSGVLRTGSAMLDDGFALTSIAAARGALAMDTELTQIGVAIDDDAARAEVDAGIVAALAAARGTDAPALEVLTWDEAIPDLLGFVEIDDRFVGDGYGLPTPQSREAIELLAHTEALFLDPTYTAKAMAGLIARLRDGELKDADTIVFWHTGGQVALFS